MSDLPDSPDERRAALARIAADVSKCTECQLHTGRTHAVPGAGRWDADILFIGEGPGFHEDRQGLPFVGQSGKYLEELLATINLKREQVFITNVVKCRPPENRDPMPDEIEICTTLYLYRQLKLIQPRVIVTLGRHSMGLFFPGAKITAIHGQPRWKQGCAYLPLFHPAAVLRNPGLRPQMEADFGKIPGLVEEAAQRAPSTPEEPSKPPTQLDLF